MRIGEVAAAAGCNIQTLRYYERRGLLRQPRRTASGYREYPAEAVRIVRFIKRAQELGFTLQEAEELLKLRDRNGRARGEVRAVAEAKMRDIEQKQSRLEAIHTALAGLLYSCASSRASPGCPILNALNDADEARTNDGDGNVRL